MWVWLMLWGELAKGRRDATKHKMREKKKHSVPDVARVDSAWQEHAGTWFCIHVDLSETFRNPHGNPYGRHDRQQYHPYGLPYDQNILHIYGSNHRFYGNSFGLRH